MQGVLLGLAIGDALGNTTESQLPTTRRQSHAEIRDYLPNRYANGHPMGVPLTPDNIQTVLKFLPVFEQPGFSPGEWIIQEGHLPYFSYTSEVLDFIRTLSVNGFIQPFDWMNWREGEQLVDRPMLLQKAGLQTLRKLLTAHVRADRFFEGHLAAMFEPGYMTMILTRMAEIHPG